MRRTGFGSILVSQPVQMVARKQPFDACGKLTPILDEFGCKHGKSLIGLTGNSQREPVIEMPSRNVRNRTT
jgi:hypothetical protein